MPKSAQSLIRWEILQASYQLIEAGATATHHPFEEEGVWLAWLEEHHAFAFHGRNGHISLVKEKRRRGNDGYWYAYQRHQGQVCKRYVGSNARVSLDYLEEIAAILSNEEDAPSHLIPAAQNDPLLTSRPRQKPPLAHAQETSPMLVGENVHPDEPLLLSKFQLLRPHLTTLPREHLFNQLDKGLSYKITLITGAAGYGKTTLVSQWIASRGTQADFPRFVSVTLDEGDNDPIRFWGYIIAACQQLQTGVGEEALNMLLTHRQSLSKPLKMMLIALLNSLSQLEHPALLILDNLHLLHTAPVLETLTFFLEHLPASLHVLFLMRGEPPFAITHFRAHNELLDLSPLSLRFSYEETYALLVQECAFAISPGFAQQIHERLEGWPTGLRLFIEMLHWSDGEQRDIEKLLSTFTGNAPGFQEYFLREILLPLPLVLQTFLLQTSVLPRITAPLCDSIMQREDSALHLQTILRSDLFLFPLDWEGVWTRYSPLFAEAMQHEAGKRLGASSLRELAAKASEWYEGHGFLSDAITTALSATAFAHAAHLITQFLARKPQGKAHTIPEMYVLKQWLECLPEEELERHPVLCVHTALTLLLPFIEHGSLEEKERLLHLLDIAEQHWRSTNTISKLAEVFAFRALLARLDGNILQAVAWSKQALAGLPQEEHAWRNMALTPAGIGELLDGDLTQAHEHFLEALLLIEGQGSLVQIMARTTRGRLSRVSMEQGKLRHAAEQLRQMQIEARTQKDDDDIARTQSDLAQILYQWNDLEAADLAVREALSLAEQMETEEVLARASIVLARILHVRGQTAQAQHNLLAWLVQRQISPSPQSYQFAREVQAQLVSLQLATGDLVSVGRWFESLGEHKKSVSRFQQWCEQLLEARFLMAQGKLNAARSLLERLSTDSGASGHHYFRMEVQVVLILTYARQGLQEQASQSLQKLLETAWGEGYQRLFLNEGEEIADLLRELLPHLHEKALHTFTQSLLSAFAREREGEATRIQWQHEPLSPQEQRVLSLLAIGNSNAEIASTLIVSINTVRTHVQNIYRKLQVNNRVQASAAARQLAMEEKGDPHNQ